MALSDQRKREWLSKKKRQGFRGYPLATLSFYGPSDTKATKLAIGVVRFENDDAQIVERLYSENDTVDLRTDETHNRVASILKEHKVKSVVAMDRIIGCPHEEGIDYPEGDVCQQCPYWANRDRWTGELIH